MAGPRTGGIPNGGAVRGGAMGGPRPSGMSPGGSFLSHHGGAAPGGGMSARRGPGGGGLAGHAGLAGGAGGSFAARHSVGFGGAGHGGRAGLASVGSSFGGRGGLAGGMGGGSFAGRHSVRAGLGGNRLAMAGGSHGGFSNRVNNFNTFNNFGGNSSWGYGEGGGRYGRWGYGGWGRGFGFGYPFFGYGLGFGSPFGFGYGGYGLLGSLLYGLGGYGGYGGYGYAGCGYGTYGGYGSYGYGCPSYGYGYGYDPYAYSYNSPVVYADPYAAVPPPATSVVAAVEPPVSPSPVASAGTFVEKGEAAFKMGDYNGAVYNWRHAVVDDSQNPVVLMMLGQGLFATGKFEEAAGATQAAMHQLPKDQWGVVGKNYKELYGNVQDYTDQLRALEKAVKDKPDNPALRFLAGFHYANLGFPLEAVDQLDKVIKLVPQDEMAKQLRDELRGKLSQPTAPEEAPAQPSPAPEAFRPATSTPDVAPAS